MPSIRTFLTDRIIKDCLPEIYRYTFESICLIALDTRLGCMKVPMDPEISKVFQASERVLDSFLPLIQWPTWKFLPPRWNKTYRKTQDDLNIMLDFGKKQVEISTKRIYEGKIEDSHEMSVLQKLILRNGPGSTYPVVTAIDLIFAGIDTTGIAIRVEEFSNGGKKIRNSLPKNQHTQKETYVY